MEQGNRSSKEFAALKLDLTKAYDRVHWGYLEDVLLQLCFHRKWVQWIMVCVTTVRYSVHFNNVSLESFVPSCGLHQSDPLSPYLFLFVADGFSRLIQEQVRLRSLNELHICRQAPGISHLLFADDTLLFIKASEEQARKVKEVLKTYEKSIGQLVNPSKCSMLFGKNCSYQEKERVLQILQVPNTAVREKYLGLPMLEGRMNDGKFKSTKEKLVNWCSNWAKRTCQWQLRKC
jgi:hypothetical protein